ncbi:nitroreductase family protein [Streptomyces sp. PsTaAH-124]|uniref:nitroreductase family protein n=1 Tax=Streptomyces sp. PsTaAH-124 TaxID=1157638 RepID=UPI000368D67A|nr:nitroreductase family protein [Streptomyces sp. PsTaAH-124]
MTGTASAARPAEVTVPDGPFPMDLWSEAVYSRRAIPDTLAAGAPVPGTTDPGQDPLPAGPPLPLAPPPLRLPPSPGSPADLADPAVLAALLHYSYGLLQHDPTPGGRPLHRAVASARCRYPSELTLVTTQAAYRFDPLRHQLVGLGVSSAARRPFAPGPPAFLVITSRFARTARLYGDYAPRLCAQEAGMLLGAAHLVAAALGLPARPGADLGTLLGLCANWLPEAGEHPMGYVELGPEPSTVADPASLRAGGPPWLPPDLASVLRARHSGAAIFDPAPVAAPARLLTELGAALADAPFDDFSCHLLVSRVTGTGPGHLVHDGGQTRRVQDGDPLPLLEQIGQTEGRVSVNFRATACTAYIAVRRGEAVAKYGADAFRRLHLTAGAVAHRICVVAARNGLSARVHNGYDAARAAHLLGLSPDEETVLFQVALGTARPGASFRVPVVF